MAIVFISHSAKDGPFVEALAKSLSESGHEARYDQAVLTMGAVRQNTLDQSLRTSDVVVSVVSNYSHTSSSLIMEFGVARASNIPIIPVLLDGIGTPPVFRELIAVIEPDRDAARVAARIHHEISSIAAAKVKKEEVQARISANAEKFVLDSVKELQEREISYRRIAYVCYGVGFAMLIGAVGAGVWRAAYLPAINDWSTIVLYSFIIILLTVLLLAGSKYCFMLGKSFMVEALRNSDRRHAINFGQFYLKAYSEQAEWNEVKEAFQHWNMDKGSSFLTQDTANYDPKLLEHVVELSKTVAGIKKIEEKK